MFAATWKNYKSKFGEMISDIARHYQLVESTATVSQIADVQRAREIENQRQEQAVKDEDLRRMYKVTQWLRPACVENDHLVFRKAAHPHTGSWLLNHPTFREWFDPMFPMVPPLLWLSGMPGAGESDRP
jgi:hypothetical protein